MHYLVLLDQTVTPTIESGRIGAPLFIRWIASVAESKRVLKAHLVEMTAYTNRWLAADLRRLYSTGAQAQGHFSLSLEYANGSSALLALTLAHDRPHSHLAIYGNHGAIYHNPSISPARDGSLTPRIHNSRDNPIANQDLAGFLAAIELSLADNRPIAVGVKGSGS